MASSTSPPTSPHSRRSSKHQQHKEQAQSGLPSSAQLEMSSSHKPLTFEDITIQNSPGPPTGSPTTVSANILSTLKETATSSASMSYHRAMHSSPTEEQALSRPQSGYGDRAPSPVLEVPEMSPTHLLPTTTTAAAQSMQQPAASCSSPQSERSSSGGSASATAPQQFCLRWNNYQSNLTSVFDQLLQNECFVDVTLACDGRSIKAHKMVLSACSPYFQTLFADTPCRHPIVIMRDVNWDELKCIVDFMYKGEINVRQDQIGPLLRIAEMLKVRGLADVSNIESTEFPTHSLDRLRSEISTKKDYSAHLPTTDLTTTPTPPPTAAYKYKSNSGSSGQRKKSPSHGHSGSEEDDSTERGAARKEEEKRSAAELLEFAEPEKRMRLERNEWADISAMAGLSASNLELRLSPLDHHHHAHLHQQHHHLHSQLPTLSLPLPHPPQQQQQQQPQHNMIVGRNVRKRRWPSVDAIFNPPESPLSGLIAAERAEQDRERERKRERDREREQRERLLLTPPMSGLTGPCGSSSAGLGSRLQPLTSALEPSAIIDIPSPGRTPHLMPPASRTPSATMTTSPHLLTGSQHAQQVQQYPQQQQQQLQQSHLQQHQQQQQQQQQQTSGLHSHSSSPACSVASTRPSSVLSRPLTPSPAMLTGRLEALGDSNRSTLSQLGSAQAMAAAAAAAAQHMDLGGAGGGGAGGVGSGNAGAGTSSSSSSATTSMGLGPHTSSSAPPPMGPGSGHHTPSILDDLEIKPGIAEMIREEERVSYSN